MSDMDNSKPPPHDDKNPHQGNRKQARFDEENIKETYRPADKDYGFDRINEPNTPYERNVHPIDADELNERLTIVAQAQDRDDLPSTSVSRRFSISGEGSPSHSIDSSNSESFEEKRKKHYNDEFKRAAQAPPEPGGKKC